MNQWICSSSS